MLKDEKQYIECQFSPVHLEIQCNPNRTPMRSEWNLTRRFKVHLEENIHKIPRTAPTSPWGVQSSPLSQQPAAHPGRGPSCTWVSGAPQRATSQRPRTWPWQVEGARIRGTACQEWYLYGSALFLPSGSSFGVGLDEVYNHPLMQVQACVQSLADQSQGDVTQARPVRLNSKMLAVG